MDPAKAAKKISSLRAQIAHHNELYYRQAKPEISDFDYDRMKRELAELEEQFPTLAVPEESPSEQIGDDRLEGFVTYRHKICPRSYTRERRGRRRHHGQREDD